MRKPRGRNTGPEAAAEAAQDRRDAREARAARERRRQRMRRDDGIDPQLKELLDRLGQLGPGAGGMAGNDILAQLGMLISSGPALAMFAADLANGLMYYNAVANQQRTNVLGMATTARCVRYMFDIPTRSDEIVDEDILDDTV